MYIYVQLLLLHVWRLNPCAFNAHQPLPNQVFVLLPTIKCCTCHLQRYSLCHNLTIQKVNSWLWCICCIMLTTAWTNEEGLINHRDRRGGGERTKERKKKEKRQRKEREGSANIKASVTLRLKNKNKTQLEHVYVYCSGEEWISFLTEWSYSALALTLSLTSSTGINWLFLSSFHGVKNQALSQPPNRVAMNFAHSHTLFKGL